MRNLLLSSVTLLLVPAVAFASSEFNSHTHTTPIELKPISSSSGIKLAAVCFLGYGDCDDVGFGKGDEDYSIDTVKQCKNEGFVNSCSSGYCMDGSCPYNKNYGNCIKENCPTNSSPTCTGDVVGKTACGGDCKKCCDDTCPSGSKSYTGSYASTTECGNKCYNCNTSCLSGTSTSYSGAVSSKNECGQSCKKCSTTCPSGSLDYTGNTVSHNECGQACKACSKTCPSGSSTSYSGSVVGYNECGDACKSCSTSCPYGTSTTNPGGCGGSTSDECNTKTCYYPYEKCCSNTCSTGSTSSSCSSGYHAEKVGSTECGSSCYSCVKDCSNTCPSGTSTSYSGSISSYNECGNACKRCSNECPNRTSTSYSGSHYTNNECGNSCKRCSDTCPSGYSKSSSAKYNDTTTTECGTTCYKPATGRKYRICYYDGGCYYTEYTSRKSWWWKSHCDYYCEIAGISKFLNTKNYDTNGPRYSQSECEGASSEYPDTQEEGTCYYVEWERGS